VSVLTIEFVGCVCILLQTVNTAARMESNGIPNRIHISGTTAAKLEEAGMGDRIVKREDKIVAKGKGEMQTFFLLTAAGEGLAPLPESAPEPAARLLTKSSTISDGTPSDALFQTKVYV
jgi:hypothetical protein